MFIRRTTVKSNKTGEPYFTYRLVENERAGNKVRQRTLMNLGRHFSVPREQWPALTARIEQLLSAQQAFMPVPLPAETEAAAQRCAASILQTRGHEIAAAADFQDVDINSAALSRPRSVGVEHAALQALKQLGLDEKLTEYGLNRHLTAAIIGNLVGRMVNPGSERATLQWLAQRSGLGELSGYDYSTMDLNRLYLASDILLKHKASLETHLYQTEKSLFDLEDTVTLYDLTNTFFEGGQAANTLAARGHSKEKRSDCPLVTLGLVLDGDGFAKRTELFEGNVSEPKTLEKILNALNVPDGGVVVMDAGLSTEKNIAWLKDKPYRYLVVSRRLHREFDWESAVMVKKERDNTVKVCRREDKETGEVLLYCHSEAREQKEKAIRAKAIQRFEEGLRQISAGLSKKNCIKSPDKVNERIGRLKQKYTRAVKAFSIHMECDEKKEKVIRLSWEINENAGVQAFPGVYCLRTNQSGWDEAKLWRTYTMLTDVEAVFRSLKSELGLRPVFHQKTDRVKGHLFITVLAYHVVQTIRTRLKAKGIHDSWDTVRKCLTGQQRVTVSMQRRDGRTVHVRKSTEPEPHHKVIYDALNVKHLPGSVIKTLV